MPSLRRHMNTWTFLLLSAALLWRGGFALRLPSLTAMRTSLRQFGAMAAGAGSMQSRSDYGNWRDVSSETTLGRLDGPTGGSQDFTDGDDSSIRNHWALLVAGSAGWSNYRHQADVCHAYQVLVRGGLRPAHIVVMMYDDIAYDTQNPFPGQVFNSPGGPNVYDGVRVDYRGPDVNAATFLAVLQGNASAVPPGNGTGRVIASGPYDRIFVFYSDHGSPGILGMPSGSFLYADQLVGALQRKFSRSGFKEAVLYVEACESGSMFEGLLTPNMSTYVTTASNAFESSWGTYCPGMAPGPSPIFSTCLGDLYSVAWMENAERCDLSEETLMDQYDLVRNRTSQNYTYNMGSHVMQYGSLAITREVAGDYEGMRNRGSDGPDGARVGCRRGPGPQPSPFFPLSLQSRQSPQRPMTSSDEGRDGGGGEVEGEGEEGVKDADSDGVSRKLRLARSLPRRAASSASSATSSYVSYFRYRQSRSLEQREADLAPLWHRQVYGKTAEDRREAEAALERELSRRRAIDSAALLTASTLLTAHPDLAIKVVAAVNNADPAAVAAAAAGGGGPSVNPTVATPAADGTSSSNGPVLVATLAREMVYGPMGRPAPGRPLVDDWDCLRIMVAVWGDICGPMDQYAMRHTRLLANLCNAAVAPAVVAAALRSAAAEGGAAGCGGGGGGGAGGAVVVSGDSSVTLPPS